MYKSNQVIHFIGIGGIGMSGIAEVVFNQGYQVTGSDLRESEVTGRLSGMGIGICYGHSEANLGQATVVVVSSAVHEDNPEVAAAHYRGIPVIPRAEMLAELMHMKRSVAVAGSHGKTTTTSMLAAVLSGAGLDPTAVIGGKLGIFGSNAKLGQGEWLVAEADESDGSFLRLRPTIAVVTNLDQEHLEHYGSFDKLIESFVTFINRVPFYGMAAIYLDDPVLRGMIPGITRRMITFGESDDADLRAVEIKTEQRGCAFTVVSQGQPLGRVCLGMPGRHQAMNALAALAVALDLEVPFDSAAESLEGFTGVGRRFEIRGTQAGVTVIDDYGHHPTEIRATLKATTEWRDHGSEQEQQGRIICVFQPHRYSRTRDLMQEFSQSFSNCDELLVTEIYPAGESPIPGISGESLSQAISRQRQDAGLQTRFIKDRQEIPAILAKMVRQGDTVLTLGAGNIWMIGEKLIEALGKK